MQASIVHPNVQNLVIRDSSGEIIAKSTLYINPKEGYGVFNNVEIYEKVNPKDYDSIYEKYMLGIKKFVELYNKQHPKRPLRKVNVGMDHNDLEGKIYKKHKEETKLLNAIKYGEFCEYDVGYDGDSDEIQCIIWEEGEGFEK